MKKCGEPRAKQVERKVDKVGIDCMEYQLHVWPFGGKFGSRWVGTDGGLFVIFCNQTGI